MAETSTTAVSADAITSTARWLLAAAGSVAAASIAGLQFSGLGEARNAGRAIGAFVAIFVATALVLAFAARVLLPPYDSLADLEDLQAAIRDKIAQQPQAPAPLPVDSELPAFARHDSMFAHLLNEFHQSPDELLHEISTSTTSARTETLTARANRMLQTCNSYQARGRFRTLLVVLGIAGALYIVAVPVLAINSAKPSGTSAKIAEATSVIIQFTTRPTELTGAGCDATKPFTGLAVGGTYDHPRMRIPAQNSCAGFSIELDAADSYTIVKN